MIKRESTCCFTGHRTIPLSEVQIIEKSIELLIVELVGQNINCFICGGALGFDMLAAEAVLKLKNKYQHIQLFLALPCKNQSKGWSSKEKEAYEYIIESADNVHYTSELYYRGCMHARNRYMVDNSAVCICYKRKQTGGTAYTVEYAAKKGLKIIEI